ncbi:hypothetical protein TWF281_000459 [Arthrobotrys megalospora]
MTTYSTKQWFVKERSGDHLDIDKTFELVTKELSVDDLKEGQVLAKAFLFSNDPAQRTWVNKDSTEGRLYRPASNPLSPFQTSYISHNNHLIPFFSIKQPINNGEPMEAYGIAEVVESKNAEYKKGDLVLGGVFWAEYFVLAPESIMFKVPCDAVDTLTLGLTGLTAYFGLLTVGAATPQDSTVVVSVAAGSTGSIVCQIAKNILGIKNVVGITGSDAKCEILKKDCGCDYALNYRSPTFKQDFEEATKDDIDVYFDNVGGEISDLAIVRMKEFGRVVVSGAISIYDDMGYGGKVSAGISREAWMQVICHKIRIEGFIVLQFADQFLKGLTDLNTWFAEGKIKLIKQVWEAEIGDVPKGMLKLLNGENTGKLITKVVHS